MRKSKIGFSYARPAICHEILREIGALAASNCVVLKPSEIASHTVTPHLPFDSMGYSGMGRIILQNAPNVPGCMFNRHSALV